MIGIFMALVQNILPLFVTCCFPADSDIHQHGVFGPELHILGRLHIITDWVITV